LLRELAGDGNSEVRNAAIKALRENFAHPEALPVLRELARDRDWNLRATTVNALASFSPGKVLPLLRKRAEDEDWRVRTRVTQVLASFSGPEVAKALPVLRALAEDQNWDVRDVAMKALGRFAQAKEPPDRELAEDLPLLRQRALAPDDSVAAEAVRRLAPHYSREQREAFLNEHDQDLCGSALAALDELLYMPDWMKARDK
jgi:HEAT repeat protein